MATKKNAFDVLGDMLDSELGAFDEYPWMDVGIDDIVISPQIREVFEDEDNTISDLSNSIEDLGFFQNVVLRPIVGDLGQTVGLMKPIGRGRYEMVAGERRYRAAKLAGLTHVHAYVRSMTDEQMERIQFAENIHRKNFELFEEAKRLQKLLDRHGGKVAQVLAEIKKPHAWFSKRIGMLKLPEQAKRLVQENVTADVEVVNSVVQIEKHSPEKAKAVVDKLKENKGKVDARKVVKDVKDQVKPQKTKKQPPVQMALHESIFDEATQFCFSSAALKKSAIPSFIDALSDDDRKALWTDLQIVYTKGANGDVIASMKMLKHFHADKGHYAVLQYVAFAQGLGGLPFDLNNIMLTVAKFGKEVQ